MKKRKRWIALAALLVLALSVALYPRGHSRGIFYRVSGGENEMYLLGSIHIGSRGMYPFGPAIQKALERASVLIFECDTQSQQAMADTQALMLYPEGDGLSAHVSAECLAKLTHAAQKTGYDITALESIKPWAVTSLFSMETLAAQMGTSDVQKASELGVENAVHRKSEGKKIRYLETVSEQLGLMDAFSPALQEYLLNDACTAILEPEKALDEDLKKWPEWWTQGDAQAFASSYLEGLKKEARPDLAREYHDALVSQRNRSMAQTLAVLLEDPETGDSFVTVGLMHLVLPGDSILDELQQMGYQVEKIES